MLNNNVLPTAEKNMCVIKILKLLEYFMKYFNDFAPSAKSYFDEFQL